MIDFEKIYSQFTSELIGNQKRLELKSALGIYYGVSQDGCLRLSFLSTTPAPKMESTKLLKVFQGKESEGVYWTCFDLIQAEAKKVYFAFCANLIDSILDTLDEREALQILKKRYITWKTMFRKDIKQGLSREVIQGLFGELYFIKKQLSKHYSFADCVKSWSGPDSTSKDFSINDNWFEVKTIGANAVSVKINSITQLSSKTDGKLVIIKVEKISPEFTNGESSIEELFKSILAEIKDEAIEGLFLNKISSFGVDISDESFTAKFSVKSMNNYIVKEGFPRIQESDIKFSEVCDVSYSLIVNALKDYLEE